MNVVHLTSSRFYGGPERQMLGLAQSLAPDCRTVVVSFPEDGHCRAFLDEARRAGVDAVALRHDTPHLLAALAELTAHLRRLRADVLCCHAYKANVLGRLAARRLGIPVVAVSRGWTGESLRVRLYEALDRFALSWMDRVVCVSSAQAVKVRQAGVPAAKVCVIANAICPERFADPRPGYRGVLQGYFPHSRRWIVGAAGRLSPEKGFDVLVRAAAQVVRQEPAVGLVVFGDGPLRGRLAAQIAALGLQDHFVLAGFRSDLDRLVPYFDLQVLPSHTEGMPNVVLEAMAAGVPVVATGVGGTTELVEDGVSGYLVPPGDSEMMAQRIGDLLRCDQRRHAFGQRGRERIHLDFTFETQARAYRRLFAELDGVRESLRRGERLLAQQRAG